MYQEFSLKVDKDKKQRRIRKSMTKTSNLCYFKFALYIYSEVNAVSEAVEQSQSSAAFVVVSYAE